MASMNSTFYKIRKLRKSIPLCHGRAQIEVPKFKGKMLSIFKPTTETEVKEVINEFGIKTSPEDPISADILREIKQSYC